MENNNYKHITYFVAFKNRSVLAKLNIQLQKNSDQARKVTLLAFLCLICLHAPWYFSNTNYLRSQAAFTPENTHCSVI